MSNKPAPFPSATPAGIYIHWPFCARKCPYCDFYTFGREHPDFDKSGPYMDALLAEIGTVADRLGLKERPRADTVYFGGGTPSLMKPEDVGAVLSAVGEQFDLAEDAEVTLEINPTAAEAENLEPLKALGVNRLSVGCQSFDDRYLEILGRDHDAAMARRVLRLIRSLGYENISLDLMFGLPGQTLDDFSKDLDEALSFDPEHLSAYGLTLHEGTPFKRWHAEGRWELPGSEVEADMFERLMDRLAKAGYVHDETSNWSLPGRESRHNSKYWRQCDVFAFGASAHGVIDGWRYCNSRDLAAYVNHMKDGMACLAVSEPKPESARAAAGEIMMLALRRTQGVPWHELQDWLGFDPCKFYAGEIEALQSEGLIHASESSLRLTRRGILFTDRVTDRFF